MKELIRLLEPHVHCRKFTSIIAAGVLERLWHFTAKYAPRGDIGRYSDAQIAEAVGWPIEQGSALIEALTRSIWLESSEIHRRLVHDWPEHADKSVKESLKRKGLSFFCAHISALPVPVPVARASSPPYVEHPPLAIAPPPGTNTNGGRNKFSEPDRPKPPDPIPEEFALCEPWEWFKKTFIGEIGDTDWRMFMRYVNTADYLEAMRVNLPLWMETRKYADGRGAAAKWFIRDGAWKDRPPESMIRSSRPQNPIVLM